MDATAGECFCITISGAFGLASLYIVSFPDPPPKRKGGSGEYSTASHHGLAIAMDSAKSEAFEVACWASVNWKCAK